VLQPGTFVLEDHAVEYRGAGGGLKLRGAGTAPAPVQQSYFFFFLAVFFAAFLFLAMWASPG
jgi:hypothetical protein